MAVLVLGLSEGKLNAFPPIDSDNILVSVNNRVYEYAPGGSVVQTIPVPWPNGARPITETTRDLCVMTDGRIAVFNGTFDPYLSIYDPVQNTWQHTTYPGWSTGNNARFGGIATYGPYIFVSDQRTFGDGGLDELQGAIRFDTRDFTARRFESQFGTHDINIGLDGLLYAAGHNTDPTEMIRVYDPVSLAPIRTITLDPYASLNGVAVDGAGTIYVSSSDFLVYSPEGTRIRAVPSGVVGWVGDIDLAPNGALVGGTYINGIILGDATLSSFTTVPVGWGAYASFAYYVPEPASACLLVVGLLVACRKASFRRKPSRR